MIIFFQAIINYI